MVKKKARRNFDSERLGGRCTGCGEVTALRNGKCADCNKEKPPPDPEAVEPPKEPEHGDDED